MVTLDESVSRYLVGLRHVGIVTDDREALIARLQTIFGLRDTAIHRIPATADTDVETRFAFLEIGGTPYEIIEPVSERFKRLLLQRPSGINHVCYTVTDLRAAVAAMQAVGVRLGHVTADGIVELPQMRMAYFDPDDTGGLLIEFVEPKP